MDFSETKASIPSDILRATLTSSPEGPRITRRRPKILRASQRFGGALDGLLERRPGLTSWIVRYGLVLFVGMAALAVVAGFAAPQGRGQEIVYATTDGSIVSVALPTGERTVVYSSRNDGGFAAGPLLNGGSRSLTFTVLRGEGESLRGDLYASDLVRGTRAAIQVAGDGETFLYGGYSGDRMWISSSRFSRDAPPNVVILNASGATLRYLEPEGSSPILGPAWTARNSLYAWRETGERSSLTAYNFFERRQTELYASDEVVGAPSYDFESNTAVFDRRPAGAGLERSRLTLLTGTTEMPIEGAEELGLYDPSLPVPELDYRMAVMWTDGDETGVGVLDPATRKFTRTAVRAESESGEPEISYDGNYVATTDASGTKLTVRRLDDGEVVLRLDDVQTPETALERLRDAGYSVPKGAEDSSPSAFDWRSVADS